MYVQDELKRISCFLAVVEYMTEQLMNCTDQVNKWFERYIHVLYINIYHSLPLYLHWLLAKDINHGLSMSLFKIPVLNQQALIVL